MKKKDRSKAVKRRNGAERQKGRSAIQRKIEPKPKSNRLSGTRGGPNTRSGGSRSAVSPTKSCPCCQDEEDDQRRNHRSPSIGQRPPRNVDHGSPSKTSTASKPSPRRISQNVVKDQRKQKRADQSSERCPKRVLKETKPTRDFKVKNVKRKRIDSVEESRRKVKQVKSIDTHKSVRMASKLLNRAKLKSRSSIDQKVSSIPVDVSSTSRFTKIKASKAVIPTEKTNQRTTDGVSSASMSTADETMSRTRNAQKASEPKMNRSRKDQKEPASKVSSTNGNVPSLIRCSTRVRRGIKRYSPSPESKRSPRASESSQPNSSRKRTKTDSENSAVQLGETPQSKSNQRLDPKTKSNSSERIKKGVPIDVVIELNTGEIHVLVSSTKCTTTETVETPVVTGKRKKAKAKNDQIVPEDEKDKQRMKPKQNQNQSSASEHFTQESHVSVDVPDLARVVFVRKAMRREFTQAQSVEEASECLDKMNTLVAIYNKEEKLFFEELCRILQHVLAGDEKSPFTRRLIQFIVDLMGKIAIIDRPFSCGTETTPTKTFIDELLEVCICSCLRSVKTTMRVNGCTFIRRLFEIVENIDGEVFAALRTALIERISDKNPNVRAAAAQSLHWFQEPTDAKDVVVTCLQFHLKNDPISDVRLSALESIVPSVTTIDDIISRTRDVNSFIRKKALIILSDQINVKMLTIAQRIAILKAGLNDKNMQVKTTVEDRLIPSWLQQYDGDLLIFLLSIDVASDPQTAEKALKVILTMYSKKNSGKETELSKLVTKFKEDFLDNRNLLNKRPLTVEKSFLWKSLIHFCKSLEEKDAEAMADDESDNSFLEGEEGFDEIYEQFMNVSSTSAEEPTEELALRKEPKDCLLKKIQPDLSHLCNYIKKFIKRVEQSSPLPGELLDMEFMYKQVMEIVLIYQITERHKFIVLDMCDAVIYTPTLIVKFHDYILPLMKFLATIVFDDSLDLLDFTANLTNKVYNSNDNNPLNGAASPRSDCGSIDYEISCVRLGLQIEELRTQLRIANRKEENDQEEDSGQLEEIKIKLNEMVNKLGEMKRRRKSIDSDISPGMSSYSNVGANFDENPNVIMKCLQIFVGCLKYGNLNELNDTIQSHLDKIVLPGILYSDPRIRAFAIEALGLCCFISSKLATKYLALFIQVLTHDVESVKVVAFRAFFDFLCQHGLKVLIEKDRILLNSSDFNQTEADLIASSSLPKPDEDDISRPASTSRKKRNLEEDLDKVTTLLTTFFDEKLDSSSDDERLVAVQGICKLLLLGQLHSSRLLSKIIVLGHCCNQKEELKGIVYTFLPIYCYSRENTSDNESQEKFPLEDEFVEALLIARDMNSEKEVEDENVDLVFHITDSNATIVDVDQMIKFMIRTIDTRNYVSLMSIICSKLLSGLELESSEENMLLIKYLSDCVHALYSVDDKDLQRDFGPHVQRVVTRLDSVPPERKSDLLKLLASLTGLMKKCTKGGKKVTTEERKEPETVENEGLVDEPVSGPEADSLPPETCSTAETQPESVL